MICTFADPDASVWYVIEETKYPLPWEMGNSNLEVCTTELSATRDKFQNSTVLLSNIKLFSCQQK
jgi:hypothetical protein